jgi:4'-phosphopantetheinyl transferase
MILGSYLASNPSRLVLQYSEKEKPSLYPSSSEGPLEFNVSHSGSIAMLAFSRGRAVGVDVEALRDNFDHEAIARRFFSAEERRQFTDLPPAERYHCFFRCWTRKEAYIKAHGAGPVAPFTNLTSR